MLLPVGACMQAVRREDSPAGTPGATYLLLVCGPPHQAWDLQRMTHSRHFSVVPWLFCASLHTALQSNSL